ncbi:MAG: hypothetical protein LBJ41_03030 [Treponema sp.]|jgi:hypothetical protein|nr:hypothetical protein [Treponema sp.]
MKKAHILITFLCIGLACGAPLFAQDALESEMEQIAEDARIQAAAQAPEVSAAPESTIEPESTAEEPQQQVQTILPMSEKPKRFFETGVDINTGVANNALGFGDLFQKEIVLDIPAIRDKVGKNGMNLALPYSSGNIFLNVNIGELFGFGIFTRAEGNLTFTLGSALLDFLAEGNINNHDPSGEAISASGGVFMEAGLRGFLHLNRWTFTVSPSAFLPLVYIPKSNLNYTLNTSDAFTFGLDGKIDVYTPFSLDDGDVSTVTSSTSNMGFDVSLGAEFGFFDWLYVGGTVNHIPLIPSTLTHRMTITPDVSITVKDPLSNAQIEPITELKREYVTDANEPVSRPLTFDIYAKWQLINLSLLKLALKPNLGFTALTASRVPNFNWGVQADARLLFLSFQLGTGLAQGVWKHHAGIGINLRIIELLAEVSLESTDFLSSFSASGLGVGLGLRFGF